MHFEIVIVIAGLIGLIGLILFIVGITDRKSTPFWAWCLIFFFIATSTSLVYWLNESCSDLEKNPKIVASETCSIVSEKMSDGSTRQYILSTTDLYINITKSTGKTFPEGTKVRLDWYDRSRFGVDWNGTPNNRKDPVMYFILPEKTEKQ